MTSLTIRTAETAKPVEAASVEEPVKIERVTVPTTKNAEMSPLTYKETTGKPYLAKMLEVEGVYDELNTETTTDMDFIHEYFEGLVKGKKAQNDSVSYEETFKHLEKIVDARYEPKLQKIKKIAEYIKAVKRMKEYATR